MGHEDAFPPTTLSNRSRLGKPTFAATSGNEQDAPKAAVRLSWGERVIPTHLRPSCPPPTAVRVAQEAVICVRTFGRAGGPAHVRSSSSTLASLRSGVPKPSVNHP
jgi:hypothetical protein